MVRSWKFLPTLKPYWITFIWCLYTVGNRVVKNPRSDFSKFSFWTFYSIVNTPTKKTLFPASSPVRTFKLKTLEKLEVGFGCGRVNFGPGYLGFSSEFVQHILYTAMSQIRLYEYMFQMWKIDPYALCIRIFNHIWNMYSYNRIWEIAVYSFERFFSQNYQFFSFSIRRQNLKKK